MAIADLKAVIQSDTDIVPSTQILYHNGRELCDDLQTLSQCQIKEGDMLALLIRRPQASGSGASRPAQAAQARDTTHAGRRQGEQDPELLRLQALGDPRVLQQIRSVNPDLASAVQDPARFRHVLQNMERTTQEHEAQKHREMALLNEDPFNIEAQAKIEEIIRQERVMENLQDAMDYTPEGRSCSRIYRGILCCLLTGYPISFR